LRRRPLLEGHGCEIVLLPNAACKVELMDLMREPARRRVRHQPDFACAGGDHPQGAQGRRPRANPEIDLIARYLERMLAAADTAGD
jgi:hypothetical protein